jgi:hypothetical protein
VDGRAHTAQRSRIRRTAPSGRTSLESSTGPSNLRKCPRRSDGNFGGIAPVTCTRLRLAVSFQALAVQIKEEFTHGAVIAPGEHPCYDLIYARMLIVAPVFMIVFLFRDVQVLAIRDRSMLARFAVYALLLVAAVALIEGSGDARPEILHGWTQRRFAFIAVLVQLAELAVGFALRRVVLGQYSWVGCVFPAPAFLVSLFAFSFAIQDYFVVDTAAAVEIVTVVWLALIGGIVVVLNRLDGRTGNSLMISL